MIREEKRIIFADDSKSTLNTLQSLLVSYGFKEENLIQAHDGLELLTILEQTEEKKEKVDIILCDWNMPKFTLRLPDDLYADLKELAEQETRSLHNMVIHILRMYIKQVKKDRKDN